MLNIIVERLQGFMENEEKSCSMEELWFMINGSRLWLIRQ